MECSTWCTYRLLCTEVHMYLFCGIGVHVYEPCRVSLKTSLREGGGGAKVLLKWANYKFFMLRQL